MNDFSTDDDAFISECLQQLDELGNDENLNPTQSNSIFANSKKIHQVETTSTLKPLRNPISSFSDAFFPSLTQIINRPVKLMNKRTISSTNEISQKTSKKSRSSTHQHHANDMDQDQFVKSLLSPNLPDDIVLHILRFCKFSLLPKSLGIIDKQFYKQFTSPDLLRNQHLKINSIIEWRFIIENVDRVERIKQVKLLHIAEMGLMTANDFPPKIFHDFDYLKVLKFDCQAIELECFRNIFTENVCNRLEGLSLRRCKKIPLEGYQLISQCINLRSIDLRDTRAPDNAISMLTNLQKLQTFHCNLPLSLEQFSTFFSSFPNLLGIDITGCPAMFLHHLGYHIDELDLGFVTQIFDMLKIDKTGAKQYHFTQVEMTSSGSEELQRSDENGKQYVKLHFWPFWTQFYALLERLQRSENVRSEVVQYWKTFARRHEWKIEPNVCNCEIHHGDPFTVC